MCAPVIISFINMEQLKEKYLSMKKRKINVEKGLMEGLRKRLGEKQR
jgi:hypothetical protein